MAKMSGYSIFIIRSPMRNGKIAGACDLSLNILQLFKLIKLKSIYSTTQYIDFTKYFFI